ncbi:hypothetical protein BBF96_08735 [Anoxybacter fermentans]|uniref:Phosphoribulokinase/uridine kinase domain-containing protein n=1 Tax=Anoxybacter fermentans TaxID=1323375 RepID=A0A3S9SYX4_9FIRM|nr:hypothetical protein [Anoxybacter fermentans]AZR73460.1 hypothetical protein BBF96_08735 [Anoxybacter fermentans]
MRFEDLIEYICGQITSIKAEKPLLIAIDGVDTSGKTTLSKHIVTSLKNKGYSIIQASIDGFHNPRDKRYRLGSKSPEGYYRDSFNYDALIQCLLNPLSEKGNRKYITAVYDFKTESEVEQEPKIATEDSILIMEGVFLLRSELYQYWDYKVFLHVDFEQVIQRAKKRDQYLFGSEEEIEIRYRSKYIPGQQIYLYESDPYEKASIVIDNNDFNNPIIVETNDEIENLRRKAFNFT